VWPDGAIERDVLQLEVDILPPRWVSDPKGQGAALEPVFVTDAPWLEGKLGQVPGREE
jgi:hypothetical protein